MPVFAENTVDEIIFSAPPRGSLEKETKTYQPIAEFLSKVIGKKVNYKQPMSWLHYQKDMWDNKMHIVFDGPHFVSWRIKKTKHTPLVKVPQQHIWMVIANKDAHDMVSLKDMQGQAFCGHAPPNFGTLTLLSHFDGIAREPRIVVTRGWKNIFKAVVDGRACKTGIVPINNLQKFDPESTKVRVIHQHEPYANQALTVGPMIDDQLRVKIKYALLSEEGQAALLNLRNRFAKGEKLVETTEYEYRQISNVLNHVYGFGFTL